MWDKIALILLIIGGVNWGLVGIFEFDLVAWLFGGADSVLSRTIYILVAISAVHELGYELSAFEIMANLFYPGMLLVSSLIFIFVLPDRKNAESNA